MSHADFKSLFAALTGNAPFPWQAALYDRFVGGDFPQSCDLPTGLGKTSVIPIWLLALAAAPQCVQRRLVYVVNRRTVVDQASDEALKLRKQLESLPDLRTRLASLCVDPDDSPLAISTLRGQFADNGEWSTDPARPAVVVGTVDMIGSRLLFSGYGRGFKSRPLHAGFLTQDVLLVHDEAHLEPSFQRLLTAITDEQSRSREFRQFKVMELSATSRGSSEPFRLTDEDRKHRVVRQRINAAKSLQLHLVVDESEVAASVADLALEHQNSGLAILVFLRSLKDLAAVAEKLKKHSVQRLTGTLRGKERDELARKDPIFARFLQPQNRSEGVTVVEGTVYLLCTSAGEVGVNISADHLVCDLTPFDSMAQRFGRVNRFGSRQDTRVDVVHPSTFDDDRPLEVRRQKTLDLLRQLNGSASPAALSGLDAEARRDAFTPDPVFLPTSDILFDAWALTTIRDELPGRPPVADFLHGIAEWEPPQTQVAWRREVELITEDLQADYPPEDLIDDYPLKPHELLRDRSDRVFREIERLATNRGASPVWLLGNDDAIEVTSLAEMLGEGKGFIEDKTILLPPSAGGLDRGTLNGYSPYDPASDYDVADQWRDPDDNPLRRRIESTGGSETLRPPGMRLIREIVLRPAGEESETTDDEASGHVWNWYVRPRDADDDGSKSARFKQRLGEHLRSAEKFADCLGKKLGLSGPEAGAVRLAAKWHDLGKHRALWQNSIGNRDYPACVLAKSGGIMRTRELSAYRHEFGSLLDLSHDPEFASQPEDVKELVLHLVAAHHGRARPHFPATEIRDPSYPQVNADQLAREVPRRFARLQRKYGRWGLAWLESLVRAADVLASQPAEEVKG